MGRRSYSKSKFWIEEDEISHVDATCYGCSNGSVAVIAHGGMPPYKYSVDGVNWQDEEYFDNLSVPSNAVEIVDGTSVSTYLVTNSGDIDVDVDNHYLSGTLKVYCKDSRNVIRSIDVNLRSVAKLKWLLPNPLPQNTAMIEDEYYVFLIADAGEDYATMLFEPFIYPIPNFYDSNFIRTSRTNFLPTYTAQLSSRRAFSYNFGCYNIPGGRKDMASMRWYLVVSPRRLSNAVQDYDGNWYDAVIIGDQVWLGSNLRTTHYADGTAIQEAAIAPLEDACYTIYSNPEFMTEQEFGYCYNAKAVLRGAQSSNSNPSNVQGISPVGWHIPSDSEFQQMMTYVGSVDNYILNNNSTYIAKALCSNNGWSTISSDYVPGNDLTANNLTLLDLKGCGRCARERNNSVIRHAELGQRTYLFTSCYYQEDEYSVFSVEFDKPSCELHTIADNSIQNLYNVRCVCDMNAIDFVKWYYTTYGSFDHQLS